MNQERSNSAPVVMIYFVTVCPRTHPDKENFNDLIVCLADPGIQRRFGEMLQLKSILRR